MPKRADGGAVARILGRYHATGLFSHAVCVAGELGADGAPEPTLIVSLRPDGRTVFDLASLTKGLATAPLIFASLERGELELDWTVERWLASKSAPLAPELRGLSIRALLGHRSGLPAWRNLWVCHLGEGAPMEASYHPRLIERLNGAAPALTGPAPQPPVYSDVGYLLLGLCLELRYDTMLSAQFDRLLESLQNPGSGGIPADLGFGGGGWVRDAVPTGSCAVRNRPLEGEVHDENCASLGGVGGHAGLFGTAQAVASFLVAFVHSAAGRRLLAEHAAVLVPPEAHRDNHVPLLGWFQGTAPSAAGFGGGKALGHLGFTGTAFWLSPADGTYGVLLTNRVISGRTATLSAVAALRREVFAALDGT